MNPRLQAAGTRVIGWLEALRMRMQPHIDAWRTPVVLSASSANVPPRLREERFRFVGVND